MTAVAPAVRPDARAGRGAAFEAIEPVRYLAASSLAVLAVVTLGVVVNLAVVSGIEHHTAQTRAFARFREELALGVAPTGQVDSRGRLLALGTPIAQIEIPAIGVNEVALEGTTTAVMMAGPGHLRDTVLPGEVGTSVVFGRATAYGGPFGALHRLHVGDRIKVTTGVGPSTFKVIDVRHAGSPLPQPPTSARLTLVTARGVPFVPSGLLWVDADIVGNPQPAPSLPLASVPHAELALAADTGNLWVLIFWLQAVLVVTVGAAVAWRSWGRARTWIVFTPPLALAAYYVTGQITHLLPNLM